MTAHLDPWDRALLDALDGDVPLRTLPDLASEAGVSVALLEGLVRVGLVVPRAADGDRLFHPADIAAVRAGMDLVEAGLPLAELLDLGRRMNDMMTSLADDAVDMFMLFVRDAVTSSAETDEEASERLVSAFASMLPASERLVAGHFRTLVLAAARRRLDDNHG